MESIQEQMFRLEKELQENNRLFELYQRQEFTCHNYKSIYTLSLRALDDTTDTQQTFQPLGKAFIIRPKDDLRQDITELERNNEKSIEENKKLKEHYFNKKKEASRQLLELINSCKKE